MDWKALKDLGDVAFVALHLEGKPHNITQIGLAHLPKLVSETPTNITSFSEDHGINICCFDVYGTGARGSRRPKKGLVVPSRISKADIETTLVKVLEY